MPSTALIRLDLHARLVRCDQRLVNLHDRAFDLLAVLAGEPEKVFPAAELSALLWPGRRVDGTNLRVQVHALRKALGPDVVLNMRQRGYQLGLAVQISRATVRSGNLPDWAGTLLGRDGDTAALLALLGQHRLVTVVGPAGIGKTRLAQHVVRLEALRLNRGAWWIDLATIAAGPAAGDVLAQSIAQSLHLQTAPLVGGGSATRLAEAMADWQGLLLVDNAEHLAGDGGPLAAQLRRLLEAAPGLTLVVTSQQTLRLPEEWVYRLAPLALPASDASVDEARSTPALRLLEMRAAASHPDFVLADHEVPAAVALVRRLDGVALAIEMAAAHVPVLGLPLLLEQLSQEVLLLAGQADRAQPRHATLRAALDWSHGLLSASEQTVLRRLSVFAGPFTADAAQQVAAGLGIETGVALQALVSLTEKSLLQRQPTHHPGLPARLRLLQSTRLHADEALGRGRDAAKGQDERSMAQRRHVKAMARLARRACEHFYVASDADWTARWLPDHDDLMLGFDRAHAFGDVEAAACIIEVLVLGANITGRVEPALLRAKASYELADHAGPLARARLLGWGSNLPRNDRSRAEAGRRRVDVWRAVPEPEGRKGLCTSLAMLAVACEEAGDQEAADAALAECRQLESLTWPVRLRRRCSWVAVSRMALLRDDVALRALAEALSGQLSEELAALGAWREWSIVRAYMGQAMRRQGRPLDAVRLLEDLTWRRLAWGFDLDAGLSMGLACAALVEAACADDPHCCPIQSAAALEQAGAAAMEALSRLAPLPALTRHFLEPLALLACRLGHPEHGALLLAGADRMRTEHQYAHDPMNARTAALAREAMQTQLGPDELRRAEERGHRLDAAELRNEALSWLQQRAASVRGWGAQDGRYPPASS